MKRNVKKILSSKDLKSIKGGQYDTGSCPPANEMGLENGILKNKKP